MATRANIVLREKGHTLWLYHHCDGYPAYLGNKLMDIMSKHQTDYADIFDIANEMIKDEEDSGFEITKSQHGDISYLYLIDIEDKVISCHRPDETLLQKAVDLAQERLLSISDGYDIMKADAETIKRLFYAIQDEASETYKEIEQLIKESQ